MATEEKKPAKSKKQFGSKRINVFLNSGWCVSLAKIIKGTPVVRLCVTNFNESIRMFFDTETKQIINNPGIVVDEKDIQEIAKALAA